MDLDELFRISATADVSELVPSDRTINLDANANTLATPAVIEAVLAALNGPTNASSAHTGGESARTILAQARDAVATLAPGVDEDGIIFTSGCTEANNMVLNAVRTHGAALITTSVEHPSILAPARALQADGFAVHFLPVDENGLVDLSKLEGLLDEVSGPVLISVQAANSETGVIQPIGAIRRMIAGRTNALFHSDAAQAFGKVAIEVGASGPHVMTLSGHKLHAPMGVGALLLAPGEERVGPWLLGGDQQDGRRSGTEPLALIAGLGAACAARFSHWDEDLRLMRVLRDRLEAKILETVAGAQVNGVGAQRLPNTSSIIFPGRDAMALAARLDAEGVLVSQGSACSSMRPTPSHVLLAMGLVEDDAFSTIRFSISPLNTPDEIDEAVEIVGRACQRSQLL